MANDRQETPSFVPVRENVEPEAERAQVEKFLEQRGVPADRADRGKGKFGQGQMRAVESNLPPHPAAVKREARVEESEPEEEPETPEEADEPEAPAPAPAKAAAPPSDEELASQLAEVLGFPAAPEGRPDPAKGFVQRRKEARAGRELDQVAQERDRLAGTVDVLLEELARARGEEPPAAAEAPPEEDPDLFVDPEGYVKKRLDPIRAEMEQLRAELNERRRNETIDSVRRAEQAFAQEHPDYHDVITKHREKAFNDFIRRGATEEKAVELLQRLDQGQIQLAQELGVAPWVMFYESARDALGLSGTPTPAAPAAPAPAAKPVKPAKPNGSIAAAKAAVASPSAATLSAGSGKLTSGAILASDMTPEDVRRMLNEPGGLRKFTSLMRERETAVE